MKKINKLLLILAVIISANSFAQLDTLNYLKQFEANKANYVGQPFSKLLNDMTQIQPKAHFSHSPMNKRLYTDRIRFIFCNPEFEFAKNTIIFKVIWEIPFLKADIKSMEISNHYLFTQQEKSYLANKIIKDIFVYRED